jgi:L-cysteine:1D-myo-inositol 2-amino-2-deoxy-alpha-D-glucopyranoside ligase
MKIYNSLSQTKEDFKPLNGRDVRMYVCGITPYDTTHLGHAFLYTFFDALNRYLRYKEYSVTYVQNVTDIDDDILKRAKRDGRDWQELGQFWTDKFVADLKTLNIMMPEYYVKATDSIPTILEMIENLVHEGAAYEVEGTVFFRADGFADYGKLSKYSREQMIVLSRERGADPDDVRKEGPLDFILWQRSGVGEPSWESAFGPGRPGWHIECSAMVEQYLGEQIDIHGGGRDLVYPHHESEIAQTESFTHKHPYVQYWMHAAMLQYQGEKMSKSLGNLIMVSDLLKTHSANAVRWVLLSHHYRTPWEYFSEEIDAAERALGVVGSAVNTAGSDIDTATLQQFEMYMDDDVATDRVLPMLSEKATHEDVKVRASVKKIYETLGFVL